MKDNTVLIYAVTLIGITLLSYILWNLDYSKQPVEEPITGNYFICGNTFSGPTSELVEEGKTLFRSNCAACHKIYKRATGPALLNSIKNFSSDSSFHFYLKKDKVTQEYGAPCIKFPQLTYEDAIVLRAYLKNAR
ncbi:cytochrome c [Dokdonia sp.]|uniref:cytochrome c n=1 Tax=Dokdonia sp. TaxID=2024995 RepID=UPI0032649EDF